MLQFPGEWKFADVAEIPAVPSAVVYYFHDILVRVASGTPSCWARVESFKRNFGNPNRSSSQDWAVTDLREAMGDRSMNATVFIDSLWAAFQEAEAEGLGVPSAEQVNAVLRRNGVGYELRPPKLERSTGDAIVAATPGSGSGHGERYALGELLGRGGFGFVFAASRKRR